MARRAPIRRRPSSFIPLALVVAAGTAVAAVAVGPLASDDTATADLAIEIPATTAAPAPSTVPETTPEGVAAADPSLFEDASATPVPAPTPSGSAESSATTPPPTSTPAPTTAPAPTAAPTSQPALPSVTSSTTPFIPGDNTVNGIAPPPQMGPTSSVPITTAPAPVMPPAPAPSGTRVAVSAAAVAELSSQGDPIAAGTAVLQNSGPLPSLVAGHPNFTAYLDQAVGQRVTVDGVLEAYERVLGDIIEGDAAAGTGLCIVTGANGAQPACLQVGDLSASPSINLLRPDALDDIGQIADGGDRSRLQQLANTNFAGGNLRAILAKAHAAFLANELRAGFSRAGASVGPNDAVHAGHLLFLAVYADSGNITQHASWQILVDGDAPEGLAYVWNLGKASWWSDSDELAVLPNAHAAAVGPATNGQANL